MTKHASVEDLQSALLEMLELAAWFQDELGRHGALIRVHRMYRNGTITEAQFLARLGDADVGASLSIGKTCPPGIARLNDWRELVRDVIANARRPGAATQRAFAAIDSLRGLFK